MQTDGRDADREHANDDGQSTDPDEVTASIPASRTETDPGPEPAPEPEGAPVEADRAEADGVELDRAELDGVELDGAELDRAEVDRAEVDRAEVDRADDTVPLDTDPPPPVPGTAIVAVPPYLPPPPPPVSLPEEDAVVPEPPVRPVPVEEIAFVYGAEPEPGPLRRFTLYASGVDRRVLRMVPLETGDFVVQGTLVILTAVVAGISALAAAGFLTAGRFTLNPVTVAAGLIWGVLIFFFDRALVSGTLNPHTFRPSDIDSLSYGRTGPVWTAVLDRDDFVPQHSRVRRRGGELLRVLILGSFRIALALATSFIIAQMMLFLIFQPEVNARTAYLERTEQAGRVAQIQAQYQASAQERDNQRQRLLGLDDPEIKRLQSQTDALDAKLRTARSDLGILQQAAGVELDGVPYQGTLSDGRVIATTGQRGNGAAAKGLAQQRDNQQGVVNDLATQAAASQAQLDQRRSGTATANAAGLDLLTQQDNAAGEQEKTDLAAVTDGSGTVRGLLNRGAALTALENDLHPETVEPDPAPACSGLFSFVCSARNWFFPPTPMGPYVFWFRILFLVIELMPITFKLFMSMRGRRPYEEAKAVLEHSVHLAAIDRLDQHLHHVATTTRDRRLAYESALELAPPRNESERPAR